MALLAELGMSMLMSLMTKAFLQKLTIRILSAAVAQTDNEIDDKLVKDVAKAWGVEL